MAEYIENMFSIPIFHLYADDWENKKESLIALSKLSQYDQKEGEGCRSDYYDKEKNYWEGLDSLISPEIQRFVDRTGENMRVQNYWFERSSKNQSHYVHNHGATGFSAIMFIDFDEDEHEATFFLSPFNEFKQGLHQTYQPRDIKSGSVLFFPSVINHFTLPNTSDSDRVILSWNMEHTNPMPFTPVVEEKEEEEKPPKLNITYV